jgi:hypothetical protein
MSKTVSLEPGRYFNTPSVGRTLVNLGRNGVRRRSENVPDTTVPPGVCHRLRPWGVLTLRAGVRTVEQHEFNMREKRLPGASHGSGRSPRCSAARELECEQPCSRIESKTSDSGTQLPTISGCVKSTTCEGYFKRGSRNSAGAVDSIESRDNCAVIAAPRTAFRDEC